MSLRSSAPTLEIALRPSLLALQWLLSLHVLAAALSFAAAPPAWAGLLISLLLLLSWLRLRRHPAFGFGPRALARLTAQGEGGWVVETAAGVRIESALLDSSVVWPRLLVLGFRGSDGKVRHRVLVGDEADAEALRRLRARLLNPPSSD
jgi:toxin CptA